VDRRIWRLRLTPAAAPILPEIKRRRAKLHEAMTEDMDSATLKAMLVGLRKMKSNLNMKARLDEDATSSKRTAAPVAPTRA
jgi:DNA-binding MarR family transcriptional regulator